MKKPKTNNIKQKGKLNVTHQGSILILTIIVRVQSSLPSWGRARDGLSKIELIRQSTKNL